MIPQPPSLRFQSLRGFVKGTAAMLKDEAYQLAKADYSTLYAWIGATPAVQKNYRPREIENLVEYYWHLNFLIHRCEGGYSSAHGYAATLSKEALKQWAQNAKPGHPPTQSKMNPVNTIPQKDFDAEASLI